MIKQFEDIQYAVTKSKRKTASIYIERDGSVSIQAPDHLADDQVEGVIKAKREWIYRLLAEWKDLNAHQRKREYVNGESFPYLGRNYRLRLVSDQKQAVVLKGGYFLLDENKAKDNPKAVFKSFYREKGLRLIKDRVEQYQGALGKKANEVRVMELQYRWASCTAEGSLNFHWKCMMAPIKVIDYIVVHELAHLVYANHSEAFWNEVDKVMPDYQDRLRWLKIYGAGMEL